MGILSFLSDHFAAVAFAEAGEFDTAKQVLDSSPSFLEQMAGDAKIRESDFDWAAVAFAEAGEFDTARELTGAKVLEDQQVVEVSDRRFELEIEKHMRHANVAAFAESGAMDHAYEMIHAPTSAGKILLVSHDTEFNMDAVKHAVSLAAKSGYELMAVNIVMVTSESPVSDGRNAIRDSIAKKASQKASALFEFAEKNGVQCSQWVEFGEPESIIKKMCDRIENIAFVLTEKEPTNSEKEAAKVPVYHVEYAEVLQRKQTYI